MEVMSALLSVRGMDVSRGFIARYYGREAETGQALQGTQGTVATLAAEGSDDDEVDDVGEVGLLSRFRMFCYRLFVGDYERDVMIKELQAQRTHAASYTEWRQAATELDMLTGKQQWKLHRESSLYDYELVESVLGKMRRARLNGDLEQLLYLVRTNWVRNLGNMGNVNLYRHSYIGTKTLIDEYMSESRLCVAALIEAEELDDTYVIGILQQTRRNIGRTALVLSGGGTFGLFHVGVLATLFELDSLPRVISGSSAGAIVASILSVHNKEELPSLLENIMSTDFNIFKDDSEKSEGENFLIKMSRFFKNGTWFDNKHLVHTMISFLGDLTFREAYNRTGKILNITVSPASLFEQPRLLNNLTAPNVLIWSAVCASCSLPGIFPSSPLFEKDPRTGRKREWNGSSSVKFVDGSVDNDLPISRLSEMFNVDHIIACQVNIHVVPFLKLSVSCVGGEIEDEFSARLRQHMATLYKFMSDEVIHLLEIGSEIGIAKNTLTKFRSVLSQQYSGDITILPDLSMLARINELLSNPTKEFLLREFTNGARTTWPKISIIENHCGQEFLLDKAISLMKGKMIVSSSLKNPLQFADLPIGLIKSASPNMPQNEVRKWGVNRGKQRGEESNTVLDDNLLETESTNSLLLLRENPNVNNNGDQLQEKLNGCTAGRSQSAHRRKSDSGANANLRKKYSSKSFSITSPPSRILSSNSYYQRHATNHGFSRTTHGKRSTGHIMFPMERRGWNTVMIDSPRRDSLLHSPANGSKDYYQNKMEWRSPYKRESPLGSASSSSFAHGWGGRPRSGTFDHKLITNSVSAEETRRNSADVYLQRYGTAAVPFEDDKDSTDSEPALPSPKGTKLETTGQEQESSTAPEDVELSPETSIVLPEASKLPLQDSSSSSSEQ
ncbi:triacylglycerol lipase KNAG_0C06530 [Huiozyma naganishii CBS 8797]|uniref:PNPLA domain-containing protein n=1 Tax=Huiozyma naganishii (strain ATCC MYA-139 / BCRC 22969 / CBS 8797 / KCTC 17520 / NBRC 10181 / NCYC 3082 / Yp74L-3) TaxID=1071383 RepID=J7S6G4_HUIN7|nr:hypothetical protein KNAG_0C06530 [Kazachstania naganishii CBS 8797]CCK69746.1 hypothetical protein KNAG_0C06530 [Kazachstania naganishii CBS 8797]